VTIDFCQSAPRVAAAPLRARTLRGRAAGVASCSVGVLVLIALFACGEPTAPPHSVAAPPAPHGSPAPTAAPPEADVAALADVTARVLPGFPDESLRRDLDALLHDAESALALGNVTRTRTPLDSASRVLSAWTAVDRGRPSLAAELDVVRLALEEASSNLPASPGAEGGGTR
jgi:hypothetical protein